MIHLAISVEGQTEENFVKSVLVPLLGPRGIKSEPILLGGDIRVPRLSGEMVRLLRNHDFVTSLVDFYGFRDKQSNETPSGLEQRIAIRIAEESRLQGVNPQVTFPYVQQYEFESLLFSNVSSFAVLPFASDRSVQDLREVRSQFPTPEDINDDPDTAPSKRIERVMPRYRKAADGPLVAEEIGLDKIRAECRRFNEWVTRLETLVDPAGQP